MITTTYACDRCKKTVAHPSGKEQLWRVALYMACLPNVPHATSYSNPTASADWCRACCESFALLPNVETPKPATPKEPSLEDVLRAMVDEQVQQALGARGGAS